MKEVEQFYEWMLLRVKSIHLADNEQMSKAFERVYLNNLNN
jgi:hypothetical protein